MKKILAIITFLIFSFSAFAQIEYPRFETDSTGQKVVLMTIEQAQALDNNSDLLALFEKMNSDISNYDIICVKVINEKDEIINSQTIQINKLKEALQNKDEQISNLQKTIDLKNQSIIVLEKTIQNKDKEINLHLGEIKRIKTKSLVGNIIGGGSIIGLIIALIAIK
jgi:hypothetical protein